MVTGSSGFIGSHLCAALIARGESVVGIDRVDSDSVATIQSDLAEPSGEAIDALYAADVVWHLAALPGIRDRRPDIEGLRYRDNVLAAGNMLKAVPPATPLIVTSSSSVYGGSRHGGIDRACRESDPLRAGKVVTILGSPERTRDVSDVRDVVRALIVMAERDVSGAVNLGSGMANTLADIGFAVSEALALPAFLEVVPARTEEVTATRADTTLCIERLGVEFGTDLRALVKRQVEEGITAIPSTLQEVG